MAEYSSASEPLIELADCYNQLSQMKANLDKLRPLPPDTVKSLHDDMVLRYTYNSNAIEGNTLTLQETIVVLKDGFTVGGKSMNDHLEAINHKDAIYFLESLAKSQGPTDEKAALGLHSIIMRSIDDLRAGSWRNDNVQILGATHIPPRHEKI
ncbi:MAG: Fic family protein, partial [Candidatus Adiutrix sp.]